LIDKIKENLTAINNIINNPYHVPNKETFNKSQNLEIEKLLLSTRKSHDNICISIDRYKHTLRHTPSPRFQPNSIDEKIHSRLKIIAKPLHKMSPIKESKHER